MKAIICPRYGSPEVLRLEELEKPAPKDDQILIRIHAASVNPADFFKIDGGMERFMGAGFRKPKDPRIGIDFAGVVETIGGGVSQFKPGDEVFGICPGSLAEYAAATQGRIALKPTNLSFEEAAAVPVAGCTALRGLRDRGKIRSGKKVLISGAGGGVGSFAVQLAKAFGAEVTGVTRTENLAMMRSIGVDHVVDYTKEDFTKSGGQYDLIYDVSSNHSVSALKRALTPGGICVVAGFSSFPRLIEHIVLGRLRSMVGTKKVGFQGIAKVNTKDLVYLKGLIEAEKIRPIIDRRYPLAETAEAMTYLRTHQARGKIIVVVSSYRD